MSTFKGRGIVLREWEAGESNKRVTLLLKDRGKLTASATGARKPKSKFLAGTQLFTYSDYVLRDGKNFFSLTQIDVLENFYAIRNDYDRFCYACGFLELIDRTVLENESCNDVLRLLLKTLTVLKSGRLDNRLVACIFTFKLIQCHGLAPGTEQCVICGAVLSQAMMQKETGQQVFLGEDGCVCRHCRVSVLHPAALSAGALYALRYIRDAAPENLFRFTVSETILNELETAAGIYVRLHFDLRLKSWALVKR